MANLTITIKEEGEYITQAYDNAENIPTYRQSASDSQTITVSEVNQVYHYIGKTHFDEGDGGTDGNAKDFNIFNTASPGDTTANGNGGSAFSYGLKYLRITNKTISGSVSTNTLPLRITSSEFGTTGLYTYLNLSENESIIVIPSEITDNINHRNNLYYFDTFSSAQTGDLFGFTGGVTQRTISCISILNNYKNYYYEIFACCNLYQLGA